MNRIQTKDLTDEQVIHAIELGKEVGAFPYELLPLYPEKVVLSKMEQMENRRLLDVGVSLRTAWVIRCGDCGEIGHYFCEREVGRE